MTRLSPTALLLRTFLVQGVLPVQFVAVLLRLCVVSMAGAQLDQRRVVKEIVLQPSCVLTASAHHPPCITHWSPITTQRSPPTT